MILKSEPLDAIPLWGVFALLCVLSWLAMKIGERMGRWRNSRSTQEKDGPIGAAVGAIMALLAFMLAFTFSLAAQRFDARRQVILEEANAIGTTFLRARMLPEPQRTQASKLLKEYVDTRIRARTPGATAETVEEAIRRSEQLQDELWTYAVAAAEKAPNDITGLFVESLNQTIDLHATRVMVAIRSRVPLVIWVVLMGLAMLGMGAVGYQSGMAASKLSPAMLAMVFAFATTAYLIVDLDRPSEGILQTGQAALLDLQKRMQLESGSR